jgi:hypothetical protein
MIFNNEQIVFLIPSLESEWILPVVLSFEKIENCFYVTNEFSDVKGSPLCRATIFHTIMGDINRFDITCRDFTISHPSFESLLEPIFRRYCENKLIELKFDCISYE